MRKKLIKIESLNKFAIVVSYNGLQVREDGWEQSESFKEVLKQI